MIPARRRRLTIGLLLGASLLGALLYLTGLASGLRLGDAAIRGFLLVPALPTPLYITMAAVALVGVGLTLLASMLQRRRRKPSPQQRREAELPRTPWQALISLIAWLTIMCVLLIWLIRHASEVHQFLERLRAEVGAMRDLLDVNTRDLVQQVSSPTTGYALFVIVIVVYGGIALLALWVLLEDHAGFRSQHPQADPHTRRVQRAMTAGLQELREHAEPRQAIVACYARLEHLLEDHGVPPYRHLTPQEYMGAALRGLDLPLDAFSGLVKLFELARYSLHPLDDVARATAIIHLEKLIAHLAGETADAARA